MGVEDGPVDGVGVGGPCPGTAHSEGKTSTPPK